MAPKPAAGYATYGLAEAHWSPPGGKEKGIEAACMGVRHCMAKRRSEGVRTAWHAGGSCL